MDYFKNCSGIKSKGLRDIILRLGFKPNNKVNCKFDYHHFQLEKCYSTSVEKTDARKLGQELDITIDCTIQKGLKLQFEFDLFWPSTDWKGINSNFSTFSDMTLTASI